MDMAGELEILLTNDDGIESAGLRALYHTLDDIATVTAVAPQSDQSRSGRATSREVTIDEHELGYAVSGTPADSVIVGLNGLELEPDLVIAGINKGANLGEYVLGRSGTVSAAVEAAFSGVPSIATSMYIPAEIGPLYEVELQEADYQPAAHAVQYLVDRLDHDHVFNAADYLNMNVPYTEDSIDRMEVTQPSARYEMDVNRNGETAALNDRIWELMAAGDLDEPVGTDRHAVLTGAISLSPLRVPHTPGDVDTIAPLAERYSASEQTGTHEPAELE